MRPGQFYDRPPIWSMCHTHKQETSGCFHLRTTTYASFDVTKLEVHADFAESDSSSPAYIYNKPQVVQADFSDSNSTSPSYIRNKPDLSRLSFQGSQWDQGQTVQDQSTTGFFWDQGQ